MKKGRQRLWIKQHLSVFEKPSGESRESVKTNRKSPVLTEDMSLCACLASTLSDGLGKIINYQAFNSSFLATTLSSSFSVFSFLVWHSTTNTICFSIRHFGLWRVRKCQKQLKKKTCNFLLNWNYFKNFFNSIMQFWNKLKRRQDNLNCYLFKNNLYANYNFKLKSSMLSGCTVFHE